MYGKQLFFCDDNVKVNVMNQFNKKYIIGLFLFIGFIASLLFGIFVIGVMHDIVFDFFNIPYQKVAGNSFLNNFFTGLLSVVALGAVAALSSFVYFFLFTIHINIPKIGDATISALNKLKIK